MPGPISVVIQIILWFIALRFLMLPTSPINYQKYIYQGLIFALGVSSIWLLSRLIDVLFNALMRYSAATETKLDDQLIPLSRKTLKVIIVVTGAIMIIQNMGYSVTSMIASLGVGGLALALAAKDAVANFFGSVVVFTDRPFQIGDWVEFAGIEGFVEEVGFRTTLIRRFDQSLVTVPNATFSTAPIINHSRRPKYRIYTVIGITYETSIDQLQDFLNRIRQLLKTHPGIDQSFYAVNFVNFGESSLDIQIFCYTKTKEWAVYLDVQEDLFVRIMEIAEEMEIEIAFPTRAVYIRDENRGGERPAAPLCQDSCRMI
jgi:MscS family membrane protein